MALTGSDRRLFMARTVRDPFDGVMNRAVRALDWDERTLREGKSELRSGIESQIRVRTAPTYGPASALRQMAPISQDSPTPHETPVIQHD